MWKKIITGIGTLVIVGGFITAGWLMDDRYAKADDAKQNKSDIKINGFKDGIRWYQDQMSYIMMRCNVRDPQKLPTHAYKNYQDYRIKKEALEKELSVEMQKGKQ